MNVSIKRSNKAGIKPNVNHFADSNTVIWNQADGKLWGLRIDGVGNKTVVLIGGGVNTVGEVHSRLHSIDNPLDHAPVAEQNKGKLLKTDLSTGQIIFVDEQNIALEEDVVSDVTEGGINENETIVQGTSFTNFVKKFLTRVKYPTYNPLPSFSLTGGSNSLEAGYTYGSLTLTYNFSRGWIRGKLVNNAWEPDTKQDDRAGAATKYIIDGVDMGLTNTRTLSNIQILDGSNTWSGTVQHGIGPQPYDSKNQPYQTPMAAGSRVESRTITGVRNAFYGVNLNPQDSNEARSLTALTNAQNGSTFDINIPAGATCVVFLYRKTLRTVSSVLYVQFNNTEVKDNFTETELQVAGLNSYNPITYRKYIYIPDIPFIAAATFRVTI